MPTVGAFAIHTNHAACRIANKVAMHLHYAATSAKDAGPIVDEALLLTLELFQLSDVSTISTRYADRCENTELRENDPDSSTDRWATSNFGAQWTADACQRLRDMGFQEKWITVLGDELDQWSPRFVSTSTLTDSVQQLATDCSIDVNATTQTLLSRDPASAAAMPNLRPFSNAVCGLAIVLMALDELDQSVASEEPSAAGDSPAFHALASFGAQLIIDRRPPD